MVTRVAVKRTAALGALLVATCLGGCGGGGSHTTSTTATAANAHATGEPPVTAAGPPTVVATGIPYPEALAADGHGGLWVVSATLSRAPSEGVWYVPPGGHPRHVGLAGATALLWRGNQLYEAANTGPGTGQISLLEDFTGHGFAHHRVLIHAVPVGSRTIGSIVQGPDGRLFIGTGALGDQGPAGHILSFAPNGGTTTTEANGLRTDLGLAFWGQRLLITVNGPDIAANSPDELQSFEPGGRVVDFGFPKCYGQGGSACAGVPNPLVRFPSHSTPEGIVVKGDVAYVADYGSSVPKYPAPTGIVRVDLRTGRTNMFWRSPVPHDLIGLALGTDGDLYAMLTLSGKVVRFPL